ncbi:MAG: glycosyltransferase family 2 protein [Candidatus Hodarchaeota archaeon]
MSTKFGEESVLKQCLEAIMEQRTPQVEVYLIDDRSTDNSIKYTQEKFPDVKIFAYPINYGFARGYNKAIKSLQEEFLVFLHEDFVIPENWMKALIKELKSMPEKTIYGYTIVNNNWIQYNGANYSKLGYESIRGFGKPFRRKFSTKDRKNPFYIPTEILTVRRRDYVRIGGFDTRFFRLWEDVDFSWRAKLYGYELKLLDLFIYHRHPVSAFKLEEKMAFYLERNSLMTLFKNLETKNLIRQVIPSILYRAFFTLFLWISGERWRAFHRFKAYFDLIVHIRDYYQKRILVQSKRKRSDSFVLKNALSRTEGLRNHLKLRHTFSDVFEDSSL